MLSCSGQQNNQRRMKIDHYEVTKTISNIKYDINMIIKYTSFYINVNNNKPVKYIEIYFRMYFDNK